MDIYATITERIINALEQGTIPWHKPWTGGNSGCISYSTGRPYSLLNHLLLGGISGEYITYHQALQAGGYVRKGERSKLVVFWKPYTKENPDTGEEETHFVLRYYNVFHLSQCEGISPRWAVSVTPVSNLQPDEAAEAVIKDYINRCGVRFTTTISDKAFYRPNTDEIVIPQLSQYEQLAEYYSTAFHEMVHSTGHQSRLNRISDVAAFGSHEYSREELTAELGAAFLVNSVGLETEASFNNSAAYLAGWLKALKDDKRLIVSAAGAAEKAIALIINRKEVEQNVGTDE